MISNISVLSINYLLNCKINVIKLLFENGLTISNIPLETIKSIIKYSNNNNNCLNYILQNSLLENELFRQTLLLLYSNNNNLHYEIYLYLKYRFHKNIINSLDKLLLKISKQYIYEIFRLNYKLSNKYNLSSDLMKQIYSFIYFNKMLINI